MKLINLTKPQQILYWMMYCGNKQLAFTPADRTIVVKNGLFPDSKSVSNAIYQLKRAGYIVPYRDKWYITECGQEYLASVLEHANKKTAYAGPKKDEWTDADFGITPEVRAYIDKLIMRIKELEAENLNLEKGYAEEHDRLVAENTHLKNYVKQFEQTHLKNLEVKKAIRTALEAVEQCLPVTAKILNQCFCQP